MVVLSFTISDDGVGAFRDALICLSKFSDDVSLEARKDSVRTVYELAQDTRQFH
jgi:cell cycle checkpoint control protein RAD9A